MALSCNELESKGLLAEIARLFDDNVSAGILLAKCNASIANLPPFGEPSLGQWWGLVCQELQRRGDLEELLSAAADVFPGNLLLSPYRDPESAPDRRDSKGGTITIRLPATYSPEDVVRILGAAKAAAQELGGSVVINLGQDG